MAIKSRPSGVIDSRRGARRLRLQAVDMAIDLRQLVAQLDHLRMFVRVLIGVALDVGLDLGFFGQQRAVSGAARRRRQ